MLLALSWKQRRASPSWSRMIAVPVPSGSPAGTSLLPERLVVSACPPRVGESTTLGHPPGGAGMMSAGCRRWPWRTDFVTVSFTYGFVADEVRWQIVVVVACVAACATANPAKAKTATTTPSMCRLMPLPFHVGLFAYFFPENIAANRQIP